MSDEKESPLKRENLEQILACALTLVAPKLGRETPDQSDQRRARAARTIADHMERAGVICSQRKPAAPHKTPGAIS
jgi:hypothetical protein